MLLLAGLRLGSEAQLRGELAEDFTAHCREALIASLTDAIARLDVQDDNDVPFYKDVSWLLVSVDPEVLLLALEVRAAYRWHGRLSAVSDFSTERDRSQLKQFSYGWAGNDEPLDLMTCIHGCATPEATRLASSLRFEFYREGKLQVIQVGMEELQSRDCLLLFNGLVREFRVPEDLRFALLTRIRFAKAFPCTASRHQYVKILLHSLAAGRRFPQKQVRELATNPDIPESLRTAALFGWKLDNSQDLFPPEDRNAMIRAFLSGQEGCFSSEFVRALAYDYCHYTPPLQLQAHDRRHRRKLPLTDDMFDLLSLDEVLTWLEDELDEEKSTISRFEERASLGQRQRIVRGLIMSRRSFDLYDEMTKEQSLLRNQYLVKVLDDSNLLERRSSSDGAVQLSLEGWKIVEACVDYFCMQPDVRSKVVALILGGMPSVPQRLLKAAMGNYNGLLAIHLLQEGGYKFLEQLPSSAICSCLWTEDPIDLGDSAFENIAKLAVELGRGGSASEEHSERLVAFVYWMLQREDYRRVHAEFLKAVAVNGALESMLEAVRRWCVTSTRKSLHKFLRIIDIFMEHRSEWEQVLEQADVRRILCKFADTVFHTLRHCSGEQLAELEFYAAGTIRELCKTSDTEMEASAPASGVKIPLPPLPDTSDLLMRLVHTRLQDDDVLVMESLIRTIWYRYDRNDRQHCFVSLLHRLESEDSAVVATAARLVSLLVENDGAAADAARDKVVATKLLELAFSAGLADKLIGVLEKLFLPYGGDGNPFAPSERSQEEQEKAVAWFLGYVREVDASNKRLGEALLRFVEALTRSNKVAMKLVGAAAGDFAALFQRIVELCASTCSSTEYLQNTMWHLLEDRDMLYNRMVEAMRDLLITCNDGRDGIQVGVFLNKLSDLAYREPAVFMQASSDTCKVIHRAADNTHYIVLRDRDGHKEGGAVLTPHFRDVFAVMLDILLPDLRLAEVEVICDRLGHEAVELVLGHQPGAVALTSNYCSGKVQTFLEMVERHKKGFVEEVRARACSCHEDVAKLLNCTKCQGVMDALAADRVVKILCGVDLDHPKAANAVGNLVDELKCFSTTKQSSSAARPSSPEARHCPEVSEEGIRAFCIQQQAASNVVDEEAASAIFDKMALDDVPRQAMATSQDDSAQPTGKDDETMDTEETGCGQAEKQCVVNQLWRINNGDLEKLVRLLWISKLYPASFCSLLENHADHTHLAKVLVAMVLKPGELRAFGSDGNGHWHRNPIAGVPRFVAKRVVDILHGLAHRHSFSLLACIGEDDAISFISLMLKISVPIEKLLEIMREPVSYSDDNISKLCSVYADTESVGDVLAHFIASNPALAPAIYSTMVSISSQVISTTLGKLDAGDHTSDTAVLRFVQTFDRAMAEDDTAAREQLKLALDPLWIHAAHDHRLARPLLQALFLAQTFSSEPADSAVQLANELLSKNTDRNLDLVLPLLWKWPTLFTVDVDAKLKLLRSKFGREAYRSLSLRVERGNILEHSYEQFAKYSVKELQRYEVSVDFEEDTICHSSDTSKAEWFQLLSQALKDKDALLFSALGDCYQPNSLSGTRPDHLSYFKFVGRLVAEAIIEDVKLDIHFTPSFLKHILGRQVSYEDMDPQVSKNITWLLQNDVDESMGLTFSVDKISLDSSMDRVFDLVPGGRDIFVTEENKHAYVDRAAKYHLTDCIKPQIDAFLEGFFQLVPKDVIRIFNEQQLDFLISGSREIDVAELKRLAVTDGDCDVLRWFWDVVEGFDKEDKARLLKFITGSAKVSHPEIGVYLDDEMKDICLPVACYFSIDLPRYKSRDQLEQKLLLAIREGCEGFSGRDV